MEMMTFGRLSDGRKAGLFLLRNSSGTTAGVCDYGASLVSFCIRDRKGDLRDVVLGHNDVSGYEDGHGSIGAVVGRFANRIGGGSFTLGGRTYQLNVNNGPNTLHGGCDPYSKRLWSVRIPFGEVSSGDIMAASAPESISDGVSSLARNNISNRTVSFCLDSPDGDQGFPGELHIMVTYTLTDDNALHIDYMAVSDKDTPLNLTNHSYFNLNGHASGSVLGHVAQINAASYTVSDSDLLPTDEIRAVEGTPLDFRIPKTLGRDICADCDALKHGGGYDHNFVTAAASQGYCEVARLHAPESGISMSVHTDLPGVQMYTANGMNGEPGKEGAVYGPHSGVCFETQFWPDAVNREHFPGGLLKAGEVFRSRTTYKFSL